eukprot:11938783-Ditylum_brightwellii.AAC.1
MSTPPSSPPILCPQCINDTGGDVVCCKFANTTDPLCCWCHFLVLGPGQWQKQLTMAQHWHDGSGDRMMVSCWCLFGGSVGCVSDWTWLMAGNDGEKEEDNDTYGTKNGVNV